jgi:predicted GIY-YIG superfamily endonuclease
MTNDINYRILQHNGKEKGGAKYTTSFNRGPWVFAMHIGGFINLKSAFQAEWIIKMMEKSHRKFRGP